MWEKEWPVQRPPVGCPDSGGHGGLEYPAGRRLATVTIADIIYLPVGDACGLKDVPNLRSEFKLAAQCLRTVVIDELKVYLEPGSPIAATWSPYCWKGRRPVDPECAFSEKIWQSSSGEHRCYDPWVGKGSTIATTQGEGGKLQVGEPQRYDPSLY